MASTGVEIGYCTTIRIGRGATPTWTKLTGIETVSFPDLSRADVDVTHLESPGMTEESIPGMKSASDWTVEKHYTQGAAQDLLLTDLLDTGETVLLEITPPGGVAVSWTAYVKGYVPNLPARDKQTATLTMRVMAVVEA